MVLIFLFTKWHASCIILHVAHSTSYVSVFLNRLHKPPNDAHKGACRPTFDKCFRAYHAKGETLSKAPPNS